MNNSRHTSRAPWLLVAASLLLAALLAVSLVGKIEPDEPTQVDARGTVAPAADEEPATTTTTAPQEPVERPRTTLAPQTRKSLFESAYASEVAALIREGFARFGADVAEQAVRVAWCESRHVPTARNGDHYGVMQLARRFHSERATRLGFTWEQVATEARANIAVAADLYADSGWRPWTCRP